MFEEKPIFPVKIYIYLHISTSINMCNKQAIKCPSATIKRKLRIWFIRYAHKQ